MKASGRKIFFRYGGGRGSHPDVSQLFATLRRLDEESRAAVSVAGRLALLRLTEFVLIVGSACGRGHGDRRDAPESRRWLPSLERRFDGLFLRRIRKAHFSWQANTLSLLGLPLFSIFCFAPRSHTRREASLGKAEITARGQNRIKADSLIGPVKPQSSQVEPKSGLRINGNKPMVYLTRKAEFAASHYYHNPDFTPEENQRLFGKCNNPNGHGHNYTLEVTVKAKSIRDPVSWWI